MLLIGNGRVITRKENGFYEKGAVAVDGNLIKEVGTYEDLRAKYPQAEFIDAHGGVIMPGLINAHEHIYSAFARGLSIKGYAPKNFLEILEGMWWKLDRQLTLENDLLSAYAVFIDCIKNGVTTVFDHHASYCTIPYSLDKIADPAKELGVRACLCYEVSDRDGQQKMEEAVLENERFIERAAQDDSDMLCGMMGLHAAFTLSDKTLAFCAEHKGREAGYHIHVAEGQSDVTDSLKKYNKRIVERLYEQGILGRKTLAIHCVHVSPAEMELLRETDTMVVHNPESNMGNACGCPPTMEQMRHGILTGLGTDGYTHDMIESFKVANILHKHSLCDPNAAWGEIPQMLFYNNPKMANRYFKSELGVLKEGAAADVIVMKYNPPTRLGADNINGHILFGMMGHDCETTICNGKILMQNFELKTCDEEKIYAECRAEADKLHFSING